MPDKPSHLIQELRVQNFGCLRDVEVELDPFTVLVGPNDSGKSMLLRAIEHISFSLNREDGWNSVFPDADRFMETTFRGSGDTMAFRLRGAFEEREYEYCVDLALCHQSHVSISEEALVTDSLTASRHEPEGIVFQAGQDGPKTMVRPRNDGHPLLHKTVVEAAERPWKDGDTRPCAELVSGLHRSLGSFRRYHLIPEMIRSEVPISSKTRASLAPDGFGLPRVFAELLHRRRELVEKIEVALREAVGSVQRVDVNQTEIDLGAAAQDPRYRDLPDLAREGATERVPVYQLEMVTTSNARVPAGLVSDGVLLFLAHLVIVMGDTRPSVLMLEEPETGIHPGLLERLIALLKGLTKGEHGGSPVQIILTTHSPMLLNFVEPHEIRVVRRGSDGGTQISPFESAADLPRLLEYQGPGEIWVNLGEEYLTRTGSEA